MKNIPNFLKLYLSHKIKNDNLISIINFLIICLSFLMVIIRIEEDAYFNSNIKHKIISTISILCFFSIIFLIIKTKIHKYNLWGNSNYQKLAYELINKLPSKDRMINALQIYAKIDLNSPYSDLTINAVNQIEKDVKKINIKNISFDFPYKKLYCLIILSIIFISLISFSNNYLKALKRLVQIERTYIKPLPFEMTFKDYEKDKFIFKNESFDIKIKAKGKAPLKINLNKMTNNTIEQLEINNLDNMFSYNYDKLNSNTKIWASYINESIIPYKKYIIKTDTLNVIIKTRPEFKNLDIKIIPPSYTNINEIEYNKSLSTIQVLEGSKIRLNGILNKKLKNAFLLFDNDSIVYMNVDGNELSKTFEVFKPNEFEIICNDFENNQNIPIRYSIIINDDLSPYVNIKHPKDNFKLNERENINLEIELVDDYGIKNVSLEYYLVKPYYLNQDTSITKINIFDDFKMKPNQFLSYNWNINNLQIGPGDEIFYWVRAFDNNIITGPGIGKSNILKAYFPSLEELYFEVEEEQENIEENFNDMIDSIDEIKNMYESISNDVLKEQTGLEQEQEAKNMSSELEKISEKINNLENTIQTIEELNDKNDLINDILGDKIQKLQDMFKDAISSDLMKALQDMQESLNEDDYKKSLEELNNFNFEMNDLEEQLDRMIDLFEQIVAEQKLDELTKKIESMSDLQKDISKKIDENHQNKNIKPMENKQNNNLNDLEDTISETTDLMKNINEAISDNIKELNSGTELSEIQKNINNILSSQNNSKSSMNKSSKNIENDLEKLLEKLEAIKKEYQKSSSLEMLTMYSRIIKNLIDMSYEQEELIETTKNVKSKKDTIIFKITTKENILLQQYKNVFIQISDLSKKSFHISAETSKTFSQIFNHLIKTINSFEQGKIKDGKKNQIFTMEYINKTILLIIDAMDNMQSSGEASGYSSYIESMEQLMSGQQALNQGMSSLLPMPGGQQPGQDGLMQSLMQQQQSLKQKLEQLMQESSFSSSENQGESLGKALDDMNQIIKDFDDNNISQESIERGKQVYKKLLKHKNAQKDRGFDNTWEAEQNNKTNLLENNINEINNQNSVDLKKLYKRLNELDNNKKLTKENKTIIQEYLRILIEEKINEK